jgi:hypothetical protein
VLLKSEDSAAAARFSSRDASPCKRVPWSAMMF